MTGFHCFLQLGELSDGSIFGLYRNGYELEHCSYNFEQGIDDKGEAQTEVRGGTIKLVIKQLPSDEIIKWSIDPRKYISGAIILYDPDNMPIEKTFFVNATCTHMKIDYEADGQSYMYTQLIIHAESIKVGSNKFENPWVK